MYDDKKTEIYFQLLWSDYWLHLLIRYDFIQLQIWFEFVLVSWSVPLRDSLILNLFKMYSQYLARIVSCVDISWLHSSFTFSSNCFGSFSLLLSSHSRRFSWYKSTKNANKNGDLTPDTYNSSQKSTTCWTNTHTTLRTSNSVIGLLKIKSIGWIFQHYLRQTERTLALLTWNHVSGTFTFHFRWNEDSHFEL